MDTLSDLISNADSIQLEEALHAVLKRYRVLFPDWELNTISIHTQTDRNQQLNEIIQVLENMKTLS